MDLVPCLGGMLISVLPGLEEEGNEIYDRILRFINNLRKRTSPPIFYRTLWKSTVTSPNVRCAAIVYLDRQLPKTKDFGW